MTVDRFGLLPATVRANVEREQMVDKQLHKAQALAIALRDLDPNLELVFFGERAEDIYGIVPGRWHVRRNNKDTGAPDSYLPIQGRKGEYREPDFGVIDDLRRNDLWRKGALDRLDPYGHEETARAEKARRLEAEAQAEEVSANARAALRVSGDGGMTARKWGRGKATKGVVGS